MKQRGFEIINQYKLDSDLTLPTRATISSAGYDLKSAVNIEVESGKIELIPTGIKAYMQDDEVLKLYPRSSLAIKHSAALANSVGIIDADYYDNDQNEGHILIPLYNFSNHKLTIKKGERIAQGIFQKYLKVDGDSVVQKKRTGGFGSSGK